MEWCVYYYNMNTKAIESFNIFNHSGFMNDVKNILSEKLDYEEFKKKLESNLFYYYAFKSEWETIIRPWVGCKDAELKIDIYQQVKLNLDKFAQYVWTYKNPKQKNEEV